VRVKSDSTIAALGLICSWFLLSALLPGVSMSADETDTLELQFQWAYSVSITDIKLVDFDLNGASEILIGFDSDSARIGIVSPSSQTMIWRSSGLPGSILSVGAGDRDGDGNLDIAAGGWMSGGEPYSEGYLRILNGPDFSSTATVSGLDQAVTAVGIFNLGASDTGTVVAGTRWEYDDDTYALVFWPFFTEGHLLAYGGAELALSDSVRSGMVQILDAIDVNGDDDPELISGEAHLRSTDYHGGYNRELDTLSIRVAYQEDPLLINVHVGQVYYNEWETHREASLDALTAGHLLESGASQIIVGWRAVSGEGETRPANLSCFDALTGDTVWSVVDSVWPHYISGLAICELPGKSQKAVCAGYSDGVIRFKSGIDGSDLASCGQLPAIRNLVLGNVDQDGAAEICIASAGSLYVYEAPFIYTGVEEPTANEAYPKRFSLRQNYPNPFNPETMISFSVAHRTDICLTIYNMLGERVRSFESDCTPGTHTLLWDGRNSLGEAVASGVYLYRLTVGNHQETKKMVLLR
jgi:hypothetical protein